MVGKCWMLTAARCRQTMLSSAHCLTFSLLALALQVNTSAQAQTNDNEPVRVEVLAVPEAGQQATPNPLTAAPAATAATATPNEKSNPRRIALLLPLRSESLGAVAEVIRSGFMAGFESEPEDIVVNVLESGESAADILDSYQLALAQHDVLVGPLPRAGVSSLIDSSVISKPTIALNHPEPRGANEQALTMQPNTLPNTLPKNLLIMGLSIEEEARQLANWAHASTGSGKANRALIISSNIAWQRRAAKAFAAQWQKLGQEVMLQEINSSSGFLSAAGLSALKNRLQTHKVEKLDGAEKSVEKGAEKSVEKAHLSEKPAEKAPIFAFIALDAEQTRQFRFAIGSELPLYATSQLNRNILTEGQESDPLPFLDGVRLLEIPWQLQRDHPAVMIYPRLIQEGEQKRSADLERLYALGIDAYRVARAIAAKPSKGFEVDGVTGKLIIGLKKDQYSFERVSQSATYRQGRLLPLVHQ